MKREKERKREFAQKEKELDKRKRGALYIKPVLERYEEKKQHLRQKKSGIGKFAEGRKHKNRIQEN